MEILVGILMAVVCANVLSLFRCFKINDQFHKKIIKLEERLDAHEKSINNMVVMLSVPEGEENEVK